MPANLRKEAIENIYSQIREKGVILLSNKEAIEYNSRLAQTTADRESSRKVTLIHDIARHYRNVIYGGARLTEDSEECQFVTSLSRELVLSMDLDIVTGGGPGIMLAAHRGLKLAKSQAEAEGRKSKAKAIGVTLSTLPNQEGPSEVVDFQHDNNDFWTRLATFLDKSHSSISAPGGYGSLLEIIYLVQMKQVGHIEDEYPIIAHPFWLPVVDVLNDIFYHQRFIQDQIPFITEPDLNLITFSKNIPDIVDMVSISRNHWYENIGRHVRIAP